MEFKTKKNLAKKIRSQKQEAEYPTQTLQIFVKEFCENSTIPGMRYFTERNRHWSERIWWVIAYGLSFYLCSSSIMRIWTQWHDIPVTVGFAEQNEPISTIPFPTVTICPQTKTYKDKLDVFSAYHALQQKKRNLTGIELHRMRALMQICDFEYLDDIQFGQKYADTSIYEIIQDLNLSLNDSISDCRFHNEEFSCLELFTPVLTGEGFCFAFNAINSHEIFSEEMAHSPGFITDRPNMSGWTPELGYEKKFDDGDYPIRMFSARHASALTLHPILFKKNMEYLCNNGNTQGFKIALSLPGVRPRTATNFFILSPTESMEILIKPQLIVNVNVKEYRPDQRQCFFFSERKLRFYKIYTETHCEMECISNFTLKQCGCVKFTMPRHKTTKLCGADNIKCYRDAQKKLFGEDLIAGIKNKEAKSFREQCNCLPVCTRYWYDVDVNKAKFDFENELFNKNRSIDNFSGVQPSRLLIRFKDSQVTTFKRSPRYTFTDFLASCGGLFGFFLGISALSIIEFIYYSTLRLVCMLRHKKSTKSVLLPTLLMESTPKRFNRNRHPQTVSDIHHGYYY